MTTITSDNWRDAHQGDSSAAEPDSSNALYVLDGELQITGEIRDWLRARLCIPRVYGRYRILCHIPPGDPAVLRGPLGPGVPADHRGAEDTGIFGIPSPLWGGGLLLGIGMDVDEEGVTTEGVKLSMFDISDPGNVTEASVYVMEDMYGTDAAYDYKAVFADVEKNLFGFRAYGGNGDVYAVFSYDASEGFGKCSPGN